MFPAKVRDRLCSVVTRVGLVLACLFAVALGLGLSGALPSTSADKATDTLLFLVFWAFLLGSPVLSIVALVTGRHRRGIFAVNLLLLLVWIAAIITLILLPYGPMVATES